MRTSFLLTALSVVAASMAGQCPFRSLQEAAAEGKLSERDKAIVESMARDPSHIPALAKDAAFHKARETFPEDKVTSRQGSELKPRTEPADMHDENERRALLPLSLPIVGGGLTNGVLNPLTGPLANVKVPTPQPFGLRQIPGNDDYGKAHQFQAPKSSDIRGGCPTLNTLANHGILDRSGITTFADAANAVQTAYGFDYDLSVFLSALGLLAGGDLPSGLYSIGGQDSRVPNSIGPALGLFKHGTFEIDGSISRQDDYSGNEATFILSRWNALVAQSKQFDNGMFGRNLFAQERYTTYNSARSKNPYFNAGAKQFAVSLAERAFVYRALPNGTNPTVADLQNIAPFFLNETFPKHWYRRDTPYGLANLAPDLVDLYSEHPTQLGANQGFNNFVPIDASNLGTTPNSYMCFVLESVFDTVPGQIQPALYNNVALFNAFANAVITPFFTKFGCPPLMNFTISGNSANAAAGKSAGGSPVNGVYPKKKG